MTEQFVAFCPQCNGETVHKACFVPEHSDCVVCLWCRTHHPQVAGRPGGSGGVQPGQPSHQPGAATLSFFGGCVQYLYISPSLFSRAWLGDLVTTHPRISDKLPPDTQRPPSDGFPSSPCPGDRVRRSLSPADS